MKLRYVVVTSVTRDDLPDGGAAHWAQTVRAIRTQNPGAVIELLIPDLDAQPAPLDVVVASKPDIIGHNIETVERLTRWCVPRQSTVRAWKPCATSVHRASQRKAD